MKKKMNYLILLLTTIFIMVGCTNVEDASITDVETITRSNHVKQINSEEELSLRLLMNQ